MSCIAASISVFARAQPNPTATDILERYAVESEQARGWNASQLQVFYASWETRLQTAMSIAGNPSERQLLRQQLIALSQSLRPDDTALPLAFANDGLAEAQGPTESLYWLNTVGKIHAAEAKPSSRDAAIAAFQQCTQLAQSVIDAGNIGTLADARLTILDACSSHAKALADAGRHAEAAQVELRGMNFATQFGNVTGGRRTGFDPEQFLFHSARHSLNALDVETASSTLAVMEELKDREFSTGHHLCSLLAFSSATSPQLAAAKFDLGARWCSKAPWDSATLRVVNDLSFLATHSSITNARRSEALALTEKALSLTKILEEADGAAAKSLQNAPRQDTIPTHILARPVSAGLLNNRVRLLQNLGLPSAEASMQAKQFQDSFAQVVK